jgi:predicted methyltransferase
MSKGLSASLSLWVLVAASQVVGCKEDPPPAPDTTKPATVSSAVTSATPRASASVATITSAEDKQKEEDKKKLEADFARQAASNKAELERWTPALRAEAKAMAEKSYPDTKTALRSILAGKHRRPGSAERDQARHPVETLDFMGLKPNMTVFEYGPGEGWYTELLAPLLIQKGKLIVNMADPAGPTDQRPTLYGQRVKQFLATSPELYGKVQAVVTGATPHIADDNSVDMVLVNRGLHGMHNNKSMKTWLGEIHRILKAGGTLGIEQHRAAESANPDESSKKGYLPEKWVISEIEAAGFKLAGKSEINANPKDTRDYPDGVWVLPPSYQLGDKDRAKYTAIGESDRMTLRFTKVAKAGK